MMLIKSYFPPPRQNGQNLDWEMSDPVVDKMLSLNVTQISYMWSILILIASLGCVYPVKTKARHCQLVSSKIRESNNFLLCHISATGWDPAGHASWIQSAIDDVRRPRGLPKTQTPDSFCMYWPNLPCASRQVPANVGRPYTDQVDFGQAVACISQITFALR